MIEAGSVARKNPADVPVFLFLLLASIVRNAIDLDVGSTLVNKTRWMIIDDAFDSEKLIEFLQALIQAAGRKVFLILNTLRVHHSKVVKAWVAKRIDLFELFYLPSYSP